MPSVKLRTFDVQSIAIIGAGPSGLATAKYLVAEKAFKKIDVYEQRSRVGGVWDYSNSNIKPHTTGTFAIQTSPDAGLAKPFWNQSGTKHALGNKVQEDAQFLSALYDRLETNNPRTVMGFSDQDWPEDAQLFPRHEIVTEHIERYADEVRHLIRFNTQVLDVRPIDSSTSDQDRWAVATRPVTNGHSETKTQVYDAVVVASGHFHVPYIPAIKGLREWSEEYPGVISHSLYFQKPEDYTGKKVITIGTGASGSDIASQIATTCKSPLLISQRSEPVIKPTPIPDSQTRPVITEFMIPDRAVKFADGTIETNIDNILFCTGYLYSLPFLNTLTPPLIADGSHVQNTYQHLFYRPRPTLALSVLQQRVTPFPVAEAQAAVLARVWSSRLGLPSEHEMQAWEDAEIAQKGAGRSFHLLEFPADVDYMNAMHDWAMTAEEGKTRGKEPPRWGEKEYWIRERFAPMRKAFKEMGEGRHAIRTPEELGFDFEEFQREKKLVDEDGSS